MVVEKVSISVATSARVGVAAIISAHMDSAEKKREEKEKMVMVVLFGISFDKICCSYRETAVSRNCENG
jgi:threonine/homoserine efflux transporter RhtA